MSWWVSRCRLIRSPERFIWSAHSKPPIKKLLNGGSGFCMFISADFFSFQRFKKIQSVFKGLVHIEIFIICKPSHKMYLWMFFGFQFIFIVNLPVFIVQHWVIWFAFVGCIFLYNRCLF